MRDQLFPNRHHDPRIQYRGANPSRLDNMTDAVFGIAITLLIFNLTNPNSFSDLLAFTKTLPAFLISITFVVVVWREHVRFSEIYTLNDSRLMLLNTIFIALVIFYVYPLRFLTLFLTNFFFKTDIAVSIRGDQVPDLMMYYGAIAFALYFVLYLLYRRAYALQTELGFNAFELFYTRAQRNRLFIMFLVPMMSIVLTFLLQSVSFILASIVGGVAYCLYTPFVLHWYKKFKSGEKEFHHG